MSTNDDGKLSSYLKGETLAITVLVAYLVVASLAFYAGGQGALRRYEPHQHAISAAGAAQELCAAQDSAAVAQCIMDELKAAEETSRDEQDLEAQQQMALWALLMVIISTGTLGVTVWALRYIKETLDETRKMAVDTSRMADEAATSTKAALRAASAGHEANSIANETMRRQLRPHVYVVEITGKAVSRPSYLDAKTAFVSCSISLRNFGQAPAKAVKGFARCFVGSMWNAPFEASLAGAAEVPLANIPPGHTIPLEPYTTEFPIVGVGHAIKAGAQSIFVEGQIQYTDWAGETYHTNFRQACSGDDFFAKELSFRPCPDWNDAI